MLDHEKSEEKGQNMINPHLTSLIFGIIFYRTLTNDVEFFDKAYAEICEHSLFTLQFRSIYRSSGCVSTSGWYRVSGYRPINNYCNNNSIQTPLTWWSVVVVQGQVPLINTINTPWSYCLCVEYTIFLNVLNGIQFQELCKRNEHDEEE